MNVNLKPTYFGQAGTEININLLFRGEQGSDHYSGLFLLEEKEVLGIFDERCFCR
jgi:hypothetical protein